MKALTSYSMPYLKQIAVRRAERRFIWQIHVVEEPQKYEPSRKADAVQALKQKRHAVEVLRILYL